MGSTEIVNGTSRALDMHIANCRYFIKLAKVEKNQSFTAHVDCNNSYMEYSVGTDSTGKAVIVTSDECVDNRTIIVREVDGQFLVEKHPRVQPTGTSSANSVIAKCDPPKKRNCRFWRLRIFRI